MAAAASFSACAAEAIMQTLCTTILELYTFSPFFLGKLIIMQAATT